MFNPEALQQATLQKLEEMAKQQASSNSSGNYEDSLFKIAFLPEGSHSIRIIPDVNSNLSHLQSIHNITKRNKCRRASYQDPIDVCPICKIIHEAEEKGVPFDYKPKRSSLSKALIYLISTDKPTEYWKPGNFYITVSSNKRLNDAILGVLTMISNAAAKNPDAWKIFDSEAEGQPSFELQVVMGQAGKVTLQSNMYSPAPALGLPAKLGDKPLPDLSEVYVSDKHTNETVEEESMKQMSTYIMQHLGAGITTQQTPPPQNNQGVNQVPDNNSTTSVDQNTAQQAPQESQATQQQAQQQAPQGGQTYKECIGKFDVLNAECNSCDIKQQCVSLIMSRNNGGN